MANTNDVWIQLAIVLGGIVTTWLTLKYKNIISSKLRQRQAPDRIEFIYDGYEGLIKELKQQLDTALATNETQHRQIVGLRGEVNHLHADLKHSRELIVELSTRLQKYEPLNSSIAQED